MMKKGIFLVFFLLLGIAGAWAFDTPVDTFAAKPTPSPSAVVVAGQASGVCGTNCRQKNSDKTKNCRTYKSSEMAACLRDAMTEFDACIQGCPRPK